MLRASSTCLVVLDRNRYSVPAAFAGRAVSVRSTATQVRIVADGAVIAQHTRRFGRDFLVCDPWHYLPVLELKPGALRNGVPFREWDLPVAIQTVRDRILKQPRGDRGFVELLLMAREGGLEALQVACELVLEGQVVTAPAVLNGTPLLTGALFGSGRRDFAAEVSWDLPSLAPGATSLIDVTVNGARAGDLATASLVSSTRFIELDAAVWSNNTVRVMARNISAATFDLAAATLSVGLTKRRVI